MAAPKKTFDEWMKLVDGAVVARAGLGVHDLPDCPFKDWFDDGMTPKGAATRALKNANDE